jgi:hypothetical protein
MRKETKPRSRRKNGAMAGLDRVCLVCPLSDCLSHHPACLQKPGNSDRGGKLLRELEQREKKFGYE